MLRKIGNAIALYRIKELFALKVLFSQQIDNIVQVPYFVTIKKQ